MLQKNKYMDFTKNLFSNAIRYVFFISLSYILLYPLIFIISNAFKTYLDVNDASVAWIPSSLYFGNIKDAFVVFEIPEAFINTIVYEMLSAIVLFCSSAVAAYGMARFNLKGKNIMMALLIINILVPTMMIIVPSYVNYSRMDFFGILGGISKLFNTELRPNLVGTPLVFLIPALLGVGYKGGLLIYIFSQFFKGLPKELEEAASIDGAGPWKTFLTIVLPSSGSAIVTVMLFSVVWYWNEYYLAQMYTNEKTLTTSLNGFTASVIVSQLGVQRATEVSYVQIVTAGCLIFLIPILIFYLFMQKKFIASIATSGIVG